MAGLKILASRSLGRRLLISTRILFVKATTIVSSTIARVGSSLQTAIASALVASIFGLAVIPAIAAYGAIPLAIYWANKIWSV